MAPARGPFWWLAIVEDRQLIAPAQSRQITYPLGAIALSLHPGLLEAGISADALAGALQAIFKIAELGQTQIRAAALDLPPRLKVVAQIGQAEAGQGLGFLLLSRWAASLSHGRPYGSCGQ
jgi:hypothetical protein